MGERGREKGEKGREKGERGRKERRGGRKEKGKKKGREKGERGKERREGRKEKLGGRREKGMTLRTMWDNLGINQLGSFRRSLKTSYLTFFYSVWYRNAAFFFQNLNLPKTSNIFSKWFLTSERRNFCV